MIKFYQIRPCTLLAKQNLFRTTTPTSKTEQAHSETLRKTFARPLHAPYRRMSCCRLKKWTAPTVMRSAIGSDFKFFKPLTWTENNFPHVLKFKIYNTEREHTAVLSKQTLCRRQLDIPAFSWETDFKFDTWNNTDLRSGRLRNTFCAWAKAILYPFPMKT